MGHIVNPQHQAIQGKPVIYIWNTEKLYHYRSNMFAWKFIGQSKTYFLWSNSSIQQITKW